ncbi:MAG: hypothetical protein QG638_1256 [Pseudomonadota bacterium]|nr:hypothetical protein [Pseudomonadota bacterium]
MHELSVLVATLGEHVIKPLVWPLFFAYAVTKIIIFLNDAKGGDDQK